MKRRVVSEPNEIGASVQDLVGLFLQTGFYSTSATFLNRIGILARNLAMWGSRMNLTAHPEDPEEIALHVIDSLMPLVLSHDLPSLGNVLRSEDEILDLGSGAGFPGLVLASACDAHFTLVESRRKRASFLQVAIGEMGLRNVILEPRRAEEMDLAARFDLVTARAFGDAGEFFALASEALKPGGLAMLYANPTQRFDADIVRIPYQVKRHGRRVERILAVRRQA